MAESRRSADDLARRRPAGEALSVEEALSLQGNRFDYTNEQLEAL